MSERPEYPEGAFWLDRDVAQWLRTIADRFFGGNPDLAINEIIRISMAMYNKPDDMWAGIEAHRQAHERGQAEGRVNRRAGGGPGALPEDRSRR